MSNISKHAVLKLLPEKYSDKATVWREAHWGDMRVGYETYVQEFNDAELLKGLPGDRCQCPHYGYLLSGKMTVIYSDHEEIIMGGEVYYMSPGHSIKVTSGTELIEFSPANEWNKLMEFAEKRRK